MKIAAGIDVGSNNVRMIAGRGEDGQIKEVLADEGGITRLAAGISQTGELSPESITKTLSLLAKYADILNSLGVKHINAAATSAVREARNSKNFLAEVFALGIPLRTITGEEEAHYTALGVLSGMERTDGTYLIYDIGGGSTELSLVKNGRAVAVRSVPLGVVKLHDRFNFRSVVSAETLQDCAEYTAQSFGAAIAELRGHVDADDELMAVGTAGSATTAAAMDLAMTAYDPVRISKHILTLDRMAELLEQSAAVSAAERLQFPGLQKGREDLMIGSFVIINVILETFGLKESAVSDYGLREGLLIDATS